MHFTIGYALNTTMGATISRPVVTTVGVLYPTYASFKALETPQTDDDKQWLTYWVVFSITTSAEEVGEKLVAYLPGYYICKCIFLVWLMLPKTRGAVWVYEQFIMPMLKKYEPIIDAKLRELRNHVDTWIEDMKQNGAKYAAQGLTLTIEAAQKIQDQANNSPIKKQVVAKIQDIHKSSMRKLGKKTSSFKDTPVEEPVREAEVVAE
ncbi:hypothetical protein LEN26_015582 [Aphanomyces euteiches]|uniref:HVA22-like protein n=1 Tax=Aphanomyces euteiches TaxID=100861 RepID=A0A6G0XGK7_9STRA|nr:hypothetical protein Ae201684_004945 [Aphanomyces euteiches]KAH9082538.1 hypothetical protein Ae201684P_009861 [Aphanomyces euteiches]KAH9102060.1 hypothetical protein LEN26_015582 [Aphanomyces euteiches]KAH9123257.1 hypothetical protein AeMF1_005710 [Aphanomyces euteiches]KAH9152230.1 hypothetical protein AeRB84_005306 [Aphanomyces euteiches]